MGPPGRGGIPGNMVCVMAVVLVDPNYHSSETAMYLVHTVSDNFQQKGSLKMIISPVTVTSRVDKTLPKQTNKQKRALFF